MNEHIEISTICVTIRNVYRSQLSKASKASKLRPSLPLMSIFSSDQSGALMADAAFGREEPCCWPVQWCAIASGRRCVVQSRGSVVASRWWSWMLGLKDVVEEKDASSLPPAISDDSSPRQQLSSGSKSLPFDEDSKFNNFDGNPH